MDWLQVEVFTASPGIDPLLGALMELDITSVSIRDPEDFEAFLQGGQGRWDYIDEGLASLRGGESSVTFYLPDTGQGKAQLNLVKSALCGLRTLDVAGQWGCLEAECRVVSDEDWESGWKQYWKPAKIGERLVVCPTWEQYAPAPGDVVLRLDPGMAFGTGAHESTQLCLELLQQRLGGGERVLDLGCGSGILAVSALLLGAEYARGADIDEVAVRVSAENAALNGVDGQADFRVGNLADGIEERFDIIFANIVADIIIELAPAVPRLLNPGGALITSGIIDSRADQTQCALEKAGLSILDRRESGGWVAFLALADSGRKTGIGS